MGQKNRILSTAMEMVLATEASPDIITKDANSITVSTGGRRRRNKSNRGKPEQRRRLGIKHTSSSELGLPRRQRHGGTAHLCSSAGRHNYIRLPLPRFRDRFL
uniref:Uncharacterized protein n=1 Tax=Bionectria ochroleuca TaxID=29856 RepID=A0A8H7TMQ1_BIOOC